MRGDTSVCGGVRGLVRVGRVKVRVSVRAEAGVRAAGGYLIYDGAHVPRAAHKHHVVREAGLGQRPAHMGSRPIICAARALIGCSTMPALCSQYARTSLCSHSSGVGSTDAGVLSTSALSLAPSAGG
eukprot:scaffold95627_cov39-Phaeocystis_antarctica.AAC.1